MKFYLIHHSHTDIGYTERPEVAIKNQVDNLYQVLEIVAAIESGEKNIKRFRWTCESFIIVEKFFEVASEADKGRFLDYVRKGYIGLSASYANLSELVSPAILSNIIERTNEFGKVHNVPISCGMQADVNGLGIGYAESLANHNVKNYLAFVHTHHGMTPMFKKHTLFNWVMPSGKKILTFSGEHYMTGNYFPLLPGAFVKQDFEDVSDLDQLMEQEDGWMEVMHRRILKYHGQLKSDGWEHDFFVQAIHGRFTDNSPVNADLFERVDQWNEKFGEKIEIVPVTLDELFEQLNKIENVEEVSGDWPDWWTDGIGSAPRELKIAKNTQTRYVKTLLLDEQNVVDRASQKEIEYDLVMYSEHTYGSWDSISNPYHAFTHEQWAAKQWYCFNAMRTVDDLEHRVMHSLGTISNLSEVPYVFRVINPTNVKIYRKLTLPYVNADIVELTGKYEIVDQNGKVYLYSIEWNIPTVYISVEANSEIKLFVKLREEEYHIPSQRISRFARHQIGGTDGVDDIHYHDMKQFNTETIVTSSQVETPYLKITWGEKGLISWFDKQNKMDLITSVNPFLPVHEVSHKTPRSAMGRNRKGAEVKRSYGQLEEVQVVKNEFSHVLLRLTYSVNGFNEYVVEYEIDKFSSRVNVSIRMEKAISADPENVYLTLPFKVEKDEVYFGKDGSHIKPWEGQIPGTLTDFYSVFEGIVIEKTNGKVIITTPDTQLIQTGSLEFKDRILFGDKALEDEKLELHVWAMNNIWETNFVKSLAGFYEFKYVVESFSADKNIEECMQICQGYNMDIVCVPVKE